MGGLHQEMLAVQQGGNLTGRGLAADAAELLTSPTDMARAASMRVGRVEQAA